MRSLFFDFWRNAGRGCECCSSGDERRSTTPSDLARGILNKHARLRVMRTHNCA